MDGNATKRVRARGGRGMVMATRVAGSKKGKGTGNKEGNGDQWQEYRQLLWQRGWRAFEGGNNGDGTKDMAACATIGERGMMVAMGHGLCVCFGVCGKTTKNKEESKIVNVS
jgi:hypothetical protein